MWQRPPETDKVGTMDLHANGWTAIVTGASSGIGAAVARDLVAAGARVVLAARRTDRLDQLVDELGGSDHALGVSCDVRSEAEVATLVARAHEHFGAVDVLVNNAGLGSFADVVDTSPDALREMLEVNVVGSFLCARAVLPAMYERGSGVIVNVCSDVSRRTFPGGAAYCASKHAQYAFSLALGAEARPRGVRVGAVLPGMVATEFNASLPEHAEDWVLRPEDVAEAVRWIVTRPSHAVVDEITVHPVRQSY